MVFMISLVQLCSDQGYLGLRSGSGASLVYLALLNPTSGNLDNWYHKAASQQTLSNTQKVLFTNIQNN